MKKDGCGTQFLAALLLLGLAVYGINSCNKVEQSDKTEVARRDAVTREQRAEEDRVAAEKEAKDKRDLEMAKQEAATLDRRLAAAVDQATGATQKLSAAKAACLNGLRATPDYHAAKKTADDAEAAWTKARERGGPVIEASQKRLDAKAAVRAMEIKASDTDSTVKAAAAELVAANQSLMSIQTQIDELRRKAEAPARAKQAAEREQQQSAAAAALADQATKDRAKQNLLALIARGIVTGYDDDGSVRVDPLTWLQLDRNHKANIMRYVRDQYMAMGIGNGFDVKSNRSDTVFASFSNWSDITVNY